MNILSIISGKNDGCSYYRITVPSKYINNKEIKIEPYLCHINKFSSSPVKFKNRAAQRLNGAVWDRLKWLNRLPLLYKQGSYDFLWINRSLLNFRNSIDASIKNPIYDFDDAVWLSDARHCFKEYCSKAAVVLAGNNFLYEEAKKYSNRIEIIPTPVDTLHYTKLPSNKDTFNVGWIGSAAGYHYLAGIEQQLLRFFSKHKDARLRIVSERYPHELTGLKPYIDFFPWSRERDVELINTFSVGIMPIKNTIWDLGKCSFKMLQYMACEVPVIASNIGMNEEVGNLMSDSGEFGTMITNDNQWPDALENYYQKHLDDLEHYGESGRKIVNLHYSAMIISKKIEAAFNKYL